MRNLLAATLATSFLILWGCMFDSEDPGSRFGARYRIASSPIPALEGDVLSVTILYGGCGGGHEFHNRSFVRPNGSAEVWLYKVTPDQPCDAHFTERQSFRVAPEVAQAAEVELVGPDGFVFSLR